MGMFDSVMAHKPCPHDNRLELFEFQTKEFRCDLITCQLGEHINRMSDKDIQEGIFPCLATCMHCKCFFEADIQVRNGIIVDIINFRNTHINDD